MGAMANVFASTVGFDVATRALEMWGGAGIMLDSPAQKYVRDTLSFLHSSGTEVALKEKIINTILDKPVGSMRD
jgi:alkylation response protein AidB-like acyl-CoA dehydrogenase